MTKNNEKIYDFSTKVDVRIEYAGTLHNAEVNTYIIKKRRWIPFWGEWYSYHIYQIVPYVKNATCHENKTTNKLLKTIACRDKELAKKYIREIHNYGCDN